MKYFLILSTLCITACSTCYDRVYTTQLAIESAVDLTDKLVTDGTITKEVAKDDVIAISAANELNKNAAMMCTIDDPSYKDYINQAILAFKDVSAITQAKEAVQ